MEINFLTLMKDTKELMRRISKNKYKYIFGVPSGGIMPAYIIADYLGIELLTVKQFKHGNFIKDSKILIVDDLIDSGKTISKFNSKNKYDVAVVYRKKHSPKNLTAYVYKELPNEWIELPHEKEEIGIEDHIQRILEYIGENTKREGLIDTPKRVAKMYREVFGGYKKENKPKITTFPNGKDGIIYDQMIIDTGNFASFCEHHIIPFFGKYYFAYIPNTDSKIVGLSKIARIVDYYSARLQTQERLVKNIVDELEKAINPVGIALVMKAEHLCKTQRGAKKKGYMITSDLRGVFKEDSKTRQEFYKLISI